MVICYSARPQPPVRDQVHRRRCSRGRTEPSDFRIHRRLYLRFEAYCWNPRRAKHSSPTKKGTAQECRTPARADVCVLLLLVTVMNYGYRDVIVTIVDLISELGIYCELCPVEWTGLSCASTHLHFYINN